MLRGNLLSQPYMHSPAKEAWSATPKALRMLPSSGSQPAQQCHAWVLFGGEMLQHAASK